MAPGRYGKEAIQPAIVLAKSREHCEISKQQAVGSRQTSKRDKQKYRKQYAGGSRQIAANSEGLGEKRQQTTDYRATKFRKTVGSWQ